MRKWKNCGVLACFKNYKRFGAACVIFAGIICAAATASAVMPRQQGVAVDGVNFRVYPSTESEIITQIYQGSEIEVIAEGCDWLRVQHEDKVGFVSAKYVEIKGKETVPFSGDKIAVAKESVNIRENPNMASSIISTLFAGYSIDASGERESWVRVELPSGEIGWISGEYVDIKDKPIEVVVEPVPTATSNTGNTTVKPAAKANTKASTKVNTAQKRVTPAAQTSAGKAAGSSDIVSFAMQYIGTPYKYGGSSPSTGFDCSGFTSYVYKNMGKPIQRVASAQATGGTYVAREDLAPGDLVFFRGSSGGANGIGHVGIYVGNGNFIHSVQTGTPVKISTMSSGYYNNTYVTARRY